MKPLVENIWDNLGVGMEAERKKIRSWWDKQIVNHSSDKVEVEINDDLTVNISSGNGSVIHISPTNSINKINKITGVLHVHIPKDTNMYEWMDGVDVSDLDALYIGGQIDNLSWVPSGIKFLKINALHVGIPGLSNITIPKCDVCQLIDFDGRNVIIPHPMTAVFLQGCFINKLDIKKVRSLFYTDTTIRNDKQPSVSYIYDTRTRSDYEVTVLHAIKLYDRFNKIVKNVIKNK